MHVHVHALPPLLAPRCLLPAHHPQACGHSLPLGWRWLSPSASQRPSARTCCSFQDMLLPAPAPHWRPLQASSGSAGAGSAAPCAAHAALAPTAGPHAARGELAARCTAGPGSTGLVGAAGCRTAALCSGLERSAAWRLPQPLCCHVAPPCPVAKSHHPALWESHFVPRPLTHPPTHPAPLQVGANAVPEDLAALLRRHSWRVKFHGYLSDAEVRAFTLAGGCQRERRRGGRCGADGA